MTIRHLKIFCEVCKEGSISKAAKKLGMKQPSVSEVIAVLESYYKTTLIAYDGNQVKLTANGEFLYKQASLIFSTLDATYQEIVPNEDEKKIRFGVVASVGEVLLPIMLEEYKKNHPELRYSIYIENSEVLIRKLEGGELDFIIADDFAKGLAFFSTPLFSDQIVAVCDRDYDCPDKMNLKQLAEYPLILRECGSGSRNQIDAIFKKYNISEYASIDTSSNLAVLNLLKYRTGIAILSETFIKGILDGKRARRITIEEFSTLKRQLYLVEYIGYAHSKPLHEFITAWKNFFQNNYEIFPEYIKQMNDLF